MLRLTRIAMLLACAVGVGWPASSEAGVIPWAYDAIFGPVGSMQQSYYAPYYSGNVGSVGANYLPAAYSYGYATNGCSSCQQSSYYPATLNGCGCSPCGSSCVSGCAGGGCASGNCAVNSAPTGSLAPIADPSNHASGIESRLEAIEKQLNIVPPREHTGTGPRTYDADRFKGRTRSNDGFEGNAVPPREGTGTGTRRSGSGSSPEDGSFSRPKIRNPDDPDTEPFAPNSAPRSGTEGASGLRDTFKTNTEKANTDAEKTEAEKGTSEGTDASKSTDPDLVIPAKKPAPTGPVEEPPSPQTLRLDSRMTSRAVSPRERLTIVVGFQKPVVAQTKAPKTNWAGNPRTTDLAQQR